ncbi:MAG: DUF6784 domain-containing protein, partial [Candidatus Hodarchaeota archaeon]
CYWCPWRYYDPVRPEVHWEQSIPFAVATFAIVIGLYVIRARGKPRALAALHPIGIILAMLGGIWFWLTWIVALALKYLTIRIGGAEAYEKKGLPMATGLIVAFCLWYLIQCIFWNLHALGFYGAPLG